MTYEATQKGNPHRLSVNQHTFPKTSIARFSGQGGAVQLYHMVPQKVFRVKPADKIFCALRVWDQQSESGYMKRVEDGFQTLARRIVENGLIKFGLIETATINDFYCLWNIRAHYKQHRIQDQSIHQGVMGLLREYTKDEEERLELAGISTIRGDLTMAGRFLSSPTMRLNHSSATAMMGNASWGVLRAVEGEFIAPDNFYRLRVVPLSPTVCLWSQTSRPLELLDRKSVAEINRAAIATSSEYYFARDLSQCPI